MAKKLTPKQEAFANKHVETGNASESYRHAYDAENMTPEAVWVEACRTLALPNVSLRVFELQERLAERTLVTAESITKELEAAREQAEHLEMPSASVSASMGKAKVNGLLVDRKEVTGKDGGAIEVAEVPASERMREYLTKIAPLEDAEPS